MRIQDHLRKMGLGNLALEKLLESWLKDKLICRDQLRQVNIVKADVLNPCDIQKDLAPNRRIFREMLRSAQTRLLKQINKGF